MLAIPEELHFPYSRLASLKCEIRNIMEYRNVIGYVCRFRVTALPTN